ncbi:mechanosensitive ion channel [Sinimarinibacterium sp. CAU 1509]|uniref:mechanosensitive ion channel family protein n=1 Tax=Sinimarinibacterium sp. CAU 1509 TaxID=2562283 RepID=UPI0010ABDE8F|nr:mechanosensitive ion channel domain-containing protein [Sinimarinibacterium sp. CAU 1509]TJY65134.1 mechanosensitive ion channel [Sinimarinibacterium sp. CAU 1509]
MDFSLDRIGEASQWVDLALPLGVRLVSALAIFVVGKWLAGLLVRLLQGAMRRGKIDETLTSFLGNVAYGVALAIVVISALGQLGVNTTSAAAVLGGAALAIGLSLQGQLSSLAAGVMIILFRPFKVGDVVEIGGILGTVDEIKIIHCILKTPDNQIVVVPNSSVTGNTITNFSALPTRRIDLTIGIGYGSDLLQAKRILDRLLAEEKRILAQPERSVQVKELADSSVNFAVRGWVNSGDWWATRCDLTERIKLAFDAEGIEIPFPQMTVHLPTPPTGA